MWRLFAIICLVLLVGCEKPEFVGGTSRDIEIPVAPELVKKPLFAIKQPGQKLSKEGIDLIIYYEVGGKSYYNKHLKSPNYPGGPYSGITMGFGYDTFYSSKDVIRQDWHKLRSDWLNRVVAVSDKRGGAAKAVAPSLKDILIEWDLAEEVFNEVTIARYYNLCVRSFPGFEDLCPNAQSAILSCVYNRGASTSGPTRKEMLEIKRLIPKKDYVGIAQQLRSMKRLWVGKGLDGLLARRDAEAALVLTCVK